MFSQPDLSLFNDAYIKMNDALVLAFTVRF